MSHQHRHDLTRADPATASSRFWEEHYAALATADVSGTALARVSAAAEAAGLDTG